MLNFVIIAVLIVCFAWWLKKSEKRNKTNFDMPSLKEKGPSKEEGPSPEYEPKRYEKLDDWKRDLIVKWNGPPRTVEFTYETYDKNEDDYKKKRRKVDVQQVLESSRGELYLHGRCHLRNENRHFNIMNITTKILDKSYRYEVVDWLHSELDIGHR